jgi:hypothetical protein
VADIYHLALLYTRFFCLSRGFLKKYSENGKIILKNIKKRLEKISKTEKFHFWNWIASE